MLVKPAANPAFDKEAPESRSNRPALAVYDPILKDFLPAYGRDVGADHGLYWHRMVQSGDVVETDAGAINSGIETEAARLQAAGKADAEAAKADAEKPQPGVTIAKPAPAPEAKKPAAPAAPKVEK